MNPVICMPDEGGWSGQGENPMGEDSHPDGVPPSLPSREEVMLLLRLNGARKDRQNLPIRWSAGKGFHFVSQESSDEMEQ